MGIIHLPQTKTVHIGIVFRTFFPDTLKTKVQEFDSFTKEVSFNMHGIVYIPASELDADPLEKEIRTLAELLQQVKDEQEYIKIRERVHRNSTGL